MELVFINHTLATPVMDDRFYKVEILVDIPCFNNLSNGLACHYVKVDV